MKTACKLLVGGMLLASRFQGFAQPLIIMQPQSQSVSLGANVSFRVSASGIEPLSYQWRRNDTALSGETNATLTLTNVQIAQAGSYAVVITDAFEDSTTSEAAMLTVDPTFTKITTGAIATNTANAFGCAWGDYDGDGFLDLIVGNEFGHACALYHNNGNGTFNQVTTSAIATTPAEAGGVGWGDFDNDGDLDLAVSGAPEPSGNDLIYRNDGDGVFTPITVGGIFNSGDTSVMCAWGDFDNDGWLDLFVTHYSFLSPDSGANNFLFQNNGDGTFTRITTGSIVNDGGNSIGCAWGDFDNDGFLDLFVANGGDQARAPGFLYHNNGNSNRWLSVKCVGAASNRSGIGAKVRVQAIIAGAALWQFREISSGNGYNGSGLRAHFGLGDATNVDLVRIEWPSGTVQELRSVAVNQFLTVTEPPRLQAVGRLPDGSFQFDLTGGIGFVYALETSGDLAAWAPWTTVTNDSRTITLTDATAINVAQRFYRVRTN